MKIKLICIVASVLLLMTAIFGLHQYHSEASLYSEDSVRFSDQAVIDWCPLLETWDVNPKGEYDMALRTYGTRLFQSDFLYGQSIKYMIENMTFTYSFAENEEGTNFCSLVPYTFDTETNSPVYEYNTRSHSVSSSVKCVLGAEKIFEAKGCDNITIYNRYEINSANANVSKDGYQVLIYCETDQGNYAIYSQGKEEPFYLLPIDMVYEWMEILVTWDALSVGGTVKISNRMDVAEYEVDLESIEVSREDYEAILNLGPSKVWLYLGWGAFVLCGGFVATTIVLFYKKKKAS